MYGQTEATARMSYVPPKMLKEKIDSIGIPIDKGKFHLKDSGEIVFEDLMSPWDMLKTLKILLREMIIMVCWILVTLAIKIKMVTILLLWKEQEVR